MFPIIITPSEPITAHKPAGNIAITSCLSSLFELQTYSLPPSNLMADLKSRIGGKRKYFSNLVWKREDHQLGHSGHHKRASSLTYNSRREENTPADYDSDASSIASSNCGEEAYFLPSNGGERRGEGPTAPFRRFRSAEPPSLLKRIELPILPASSPTKRANAVQESPKRLIERIGNGLYAAQHTPIMLHSEDMDIDSTPAPDGTIAEEAPNGHVWTDQARHEAVAVSGINTMAIDTVHDEAGKCIVESAPTISDDSLNNRVEDSNGDHRQPADEGSAAHKNLEAIPGLTFSERDNNLNAPVQHQNAAASSSSSPAFLVPATEGGSLEQTMNSSTTPQALPTRNSPHSSPEEGQWEEPSLPVPPDFILNVRKLLLPLITQNAQCRTDFGQETIPSPESVERALSGVVDDEACTSFAGQMRGIRREMVALNATAVKKPVVSIQADGSQVAQEESGSMSSQSLPVEKANWTPPWGPRAMRQGSSQLKKIELMKSPSYGDYFKKGQNKTEAPIAKGPKYHEQLKPKDKADESSKYLQLREIRDRRAGYEAKRSSTKDYASRQDSLNGQVEAGRTSDRDYARSHYRRDSSDMQIEARPRRSSIPDRRSDSLEKPPAPVRTPTTLAFKDSGSKGSLDPRRPSLWHDPNISSDGIDRTKRHVAPDRRTSHSSTSATRRSPSRSPPRRTRSPPYSRSHARPDKIHSPSRRRYSPPPPSTSRSADFSSRRARSPARNGRSPSPEHLRVKRGRSRSRSPISRYQKEASPTRKDLYTSRHRSPYYPEAPRRSAKKPYSPIRRSKSPPMRKRTPTIERLDKTPRKSRSPKRRRYESPQPRTEIDSRSPSPSRSHSLSGSLGTGKRHRLPESRPASTIIYSPRRSSTRSTLEGLNEEERKPKINHLNGTSATHPRPPTPVLSNSCHNVPGLWFVKMGSKHTNILECSFEIDKETAAKWDIPEISLISEKRTVPSQMGKPRLCLQILCLPTDLVQSVQGTIQPGASAGDVAIALSTIKESWPPTGNLIIEVNPGTGHGHTWLPFDLEPTSPSVNLEDHIHEGKNVVQLIQLAGMADHIFVLFASLQQPPSPPPPPPPKFPHDLNKVLAETKLKLGDVGSIPPHFMISSDMFEIAASAPWNTVLLHIQSQTRLGS